jgi:hypothetical protein
MTLFQRWIRNTSEPRSRATPATQNAEASLGGHTLHDERFAAFERRAADTFGDDTIRRRFST